MHKFWFRLKKYKLIECAMIKTFLINSWTITNITPEPKLNLADFLIKYWDVIVANPIFFISTAFAFLGLGFYTGKLVYGTITNITKERLEAARDDLGRLEKAKKDESETVARLQAELKKCFKDRGHILHAPVFKNGTAEGSAETNESKKSSVKVNSGIEIADSFFLSIPHRNLEDALVDAKKNEKLVFAVIYDETHPKFSKLSYSLGYFMEYHTTKSLVDEYFVSAIIKASDEQAASLIPSDDPLENCLWVVLTPEGEILRREGVYANPDEGLKRVRAVMASAGKV